MSLTFPENLRIEYVKGTRMRMILETYRIQMPEWFPLTELVIPAGYRTDLASIPRPVWWLIDPADPRIRRASIAHDFCYNQCSHLVTKDEADRLLVEACALDGMSWPMRQAVYYSVKFGGTMGTKVDEVILHDPTNRACILKMRDGQVLQLAHPLAEWEPKVGMKIRRMGSNWFWHPRSRTSLRVVAKSWSDARMHNVTSMHPKPG